MGWPPFNDKIEGGGLMNLFNLSQSTSAAFFPFTSANGQNYLWKDSYHTEYEKSNHCFPGQNGIWSKF